ncbi:MAG: amidase family protein, partial [Gaiellaceae bacterium]
MHELAFLPATEQARLVREREVSPVELVELYLERIERLDTGLEPRLGAYVTVRGEEALAEARQKAAAQADAPFHGVPISLKDLDTTAGIRTTFSSRAF